LFSRRYKKMGLPDTEKHIADKMILCSGLLEPIGLGIIHFPESESTCIGNLHPLFIHITEIHEHPTMNSLENGQLLPKKELITLLLSGESVSYHDKVRKSFCEKRVYALHVLSYHFFKMGHNLFMIRNIELVENCTTYQN